jgi:hypothetical protein
VANAKSHVALTGRIFEIWHYVRDRMRAIAEPVTNSFQIPKMDGLAFLLVRQ